MQTTKGAKEQMPGQGHVGETRKENWFDAMIADWTVRSGLSALGSGTQPGHRRHSTCTDWQGFINPPHLHDSSSEFSLNASMTVPLPATNSPSASAMNFGEPGLAVRRLIPVLVVSPSVVVYYRGTNKNAVYPSDQHAVIRARRPIL